MSSLLTKLQHYRQVASSSEQLIIDYLLAQPHTVIHSTVHDVAKQTYTSSASVIRLAQKIGLKGYRELKEQLISEVTLKDYVKVGKQHEIKQHESTHEIVDKLMNQYAHTLKLTRQLQDSAMLIDVVTQIKQATTIYLFGIGSSYLVARDFQQKLLRLGKSCIISEDYHMQKLHSQILTHDALAVMFSYSGQTPEMIQCAQRIKDKGATLISLTRSNESDVALLSDYPLVVADDEKTERKGAITSRISQLYVIDILYMMYISSEYEDSLFHIHQTQIIK